MVQAGQVTQATKDKEAIIIQEAVKLGPDLSRDLSSLGLVACCERGQLDLCQAFSLSLPGV